MRHISRRLPLFALLLATAFSGTRLARADEAALVLASGSEGERVFGKPGSVVLSTGSMAWQHQSTPESATAAASSSIYASAALNADVFVASQWSLGLGVALAWSHAGAGDSSLSSTSYALAGRLGRAIPLGRFATLWPQASLNSGREPLFVGGDKDTVVGAAFDLPLLLHPTPHLFVGAGPVLTARGGQDWQTFWLAGHLLFGGTFGA